MNRCDGCKYYGENQGDVWCYLYDIVPIGGVCQDYDSGAEVSAKEDCEDMDEGTIKDSGDRTEFSTGAVRDMHEGKGRFDLLPMCVLIRLARHYENGSIKYGDRNGVKGIPCLSFADSAMRHLVKSMDGLTDEDHLIAAIWNLCGLAWTEEKKPELMDIPSRKEKTE